jgi:hypothetical protein
MERRPVKTVSAKAADPLLLKREFVANASTSSLALQPPILSHALRRRNVQDVPNDPAAAEQSSVFKNHGSIDHSESETGVALKSEETLPMRNSQPPQPLSTIASFGRRDSMITVPTILRHAQRSIEGTSGFGREGLHTCDGISLQRGSPSSLRRTTADSQGLPPLVKAMQRLPSASSLPGIVWRKADPGFSNAGRSLSELTPLARDSESISSTPSVVLARQVANPGGLTPPRHDTPSMTELLNHRSTSPPSIAEVAEEVSRFLSRQLIVERERRGATL